jgi:CheY-like chemotaxis protein
MGLRAAAASTPLPRGATPSAGLRGHILLADEDASFRSALATVLAAMGYEVMLACDGEMAIECAAAAADRGVFPDAFVLDFRLPRLSGLGVVHTLRRLPCVPPVILLSGFVDPSVELVARRLGIHRVLFKPVEVKTVVDALERALD